MAQVDFSDNAMQPQNPEAMVRAEATRQGVDPDLVARVARQESAFQPSAVSPKGATGVMQLMPDTAASLGVDPTDPRQNIEGGVRYLKMLMDRYPGDLPKALAAYNAGMGTVDSGRPLPAETKNYVAMIAQNYRPAAPKATGGIDFSDAAIGTPIAAPASDPDEELPTPPARGPLAKSNRPGFLTRSLIETVTGEGASQGYEKLLPKLQSILPKSMQGSYASELAGEISKAGPEMVDFITSPVGLGLAAAHLFPASAPFAAAADLILGGQQALQAIPDAIDAAKNLQDPHKMGKLIVDVLGAYAGLKGGSRVAGALREMPAGTARGLPMVKAYADAFQRTTPPPAALTGPDLRARLEAAGPSFRPAIVANAESPTNLRAQVEQKIYQNPLLGGIANVLLPGMKKPPLLDMAQGMVNERAATISDQYNLVRRDMDWIRRNVPEEEQNVRKLGYAMEGDIPESSLSPQGQEALKKLRALNVSRDAMLRSVYGDEINLRDPESYIRHYWDFEDSGTGTSLLSPSSNAGRLGAASRMMKDPALQARTIGSLKLGIEQYKLTPRYNNVTDVVQRRHMEATLAAENQKFANTLRDYGLILDPTKANERQNPWPKAVEAPALMRAVYAGKTDAGNPIMKPKPPLVHPDIAMAVNAIYNEPFKGPIANAVAQLAAFQKQIAVGFSLFHNNALSEVSQAEAAGTGGASAIPRVAKAIAWPFDPEFAKAVRSAIWELQGKVAPEAPPDIRLRREVVEPWIKANLSFQSAESESAVIAAARNVLADKGPILKAVGAPFRKIADMQYVFNRALFDYYLPGQMLHSAEHLFASEMNRLGPDAPPSAVFGLRREIADHINRAYGADNMQRLLLTPKAQQALKFTLFAPMWTLSNLRVLSKGYETTTGSRLTNRYVAGAALTYFLTAQLANYAASDWAAKHGDKGGEYWDDQTQQWKRGAHWTWQNPGMPVKIGGKYVPGVTDNSANIYFGQNADGGARYIRLGKAFREPFRWLMAPVEMLGSKLSLPIRQAIVEFSGNEPGTHYPVINPKFTPDQQDEQIWASRIGSVTPFVAQSMLQKLERYISPQVFKEQAATSQQYGLPMRKGVNFYAAVDALRGALEDGRVDVAKQIVRTAGLNGINQKSLMRELRSRLFSQARTEIGIPKTGAPPTSQPATVAPVDFSDSRVYPE